MSEQEMEQQDFTEDYTGGDFQENGVENGDTAVGKDANGENADNMQDSGAADAPGRDDDSDDVANQLVTSSLPVETVTYRKLFVGGLSWETTEKELREYFSKYGEIESINVKTDPNTGRSRGFAFIVFNVAEAIDKIIEVSEHTINGKKVDPKKAKARHGKIFVGGLKPELTDDEIKTFFASYGSIVEVEMPFDKQKNQRKGFCFITFEQEQVVNDLLKTPKQTINGHQVDVKKATPKPDQMMMRGGMRGGYDYGYGNYGYGGYGGYDYSGYGYGGYGGYGGQGYSGGKSQRGRQQTRHQPY